jgi:transposase InsO family protein
VNLSIGRTGVYWDNAVTESFFATLKNEIYHRQRFTTKARLRYAIAHDIEVFYNPTRMHSTLGYRTPTQALGDHRSAAAAA